MEQLVTSEFRLGIIAGGQLGKMLVLAASTWDVKTFVLDADEHCPAAPACTQLVRGSRHSYDDVLAFGRSVNLLTFEIEDVNIDALRALKVEGRRVVPDPEVLALIQDKGLQKEFYAAHGIPTAPFSLYDSAAEIRAAVADGRLAPPFVQKLRRGGYDGKGVAVIDTADDLSRLLEGNSVVERRVDIPKEVPADVPASLEDEAESVAGRLAEALGLSGLLAVEMFVDATGALWVNESAPRAHNSGHHSIESIITSQFEQQLRAIFNFPLGSTRLKMPAVMVNLLGEPGCEGRVKYEGMTDCMAIDGVKIHLYGKKETRPFRKMGHVTVMAPTLAEAMEKASLVKHTLKVRSW